jgi:hypothetical protein
MEVESLKWCKALLLMTGLILTGLPRESSAIPYSYPGIRYVSPYSQSMGGVTLPLSNETGNSLFNNPAGLAKNTKFRAEYLNLQFDVNSGLAGDMTQATKMFNLGTLTGVLNSDINYLYSGGIGNLTAVSWGGFAVGLLLQDRVRAYSDGTNVHYETNSLAVPALGYGFSLARGVVRLGYSLQFVNLATGTTQATADSGARFLSGLSEGKGLAHTASVNFAFPFTYLPTLSLVARNIGGVTYATGSLLPRANSPIGAPPTEEMTVDAAFGMMVRVSGQVKTNWYLQYKDINNRVSVPFLEKMNLGLDISLSPAVGIRAGMTGNQFSAGLGYRSESSEINLAYYKDPTPFKDISYYDTRFALQYKVLFQDQNTRNREEEGKPR